MSRYHTIARRALLFGLPAGLLCVHAVQAKDGMAARIAKAQSHLSATIRDNDAIARAGLYLPDARSLPEYQPALYGTAAIGAYHRALLTRKRVTGYTATTTEIIDLGGAAIETGTFDIAWQDGKSEAGKYLNLWSLSSGKPRLMADTWGYFRPLPDPQAFYVDLPPGQAPVASTDPDIKRQLDDLNQRNAEAVLAKDAETQIGFYTEDAAFMPHADTTKSGIAAIASHLRRYVQNGSGATFDTVEVWNEGFDVFTAHITEYSRFRVQWRTPDASGVVTGGGIRLWKRMPDGRLKKHRALGTHYHNA
jgi:ketosteroid isomerase-like protein